ncbi:uncharacterized protein LOC111055825 [Nilaparvata lugens]|uniref:uncharacterized protein LOC111055825 n=1 Tax=Nilaparvata lugens TaxID=108931 RepID=UPI00193E1BCB|nr:uncharacterized protein LOC111055825 [Nilaparvata lugens]
MTRTVEMCSRQKRNYKKVNCVSQFVFISSLLTFLLVSSVDGQLSQEQGEDGPRLSPPHHYTRAIQRSYSAAIRPDAQLPDQVSIEQLQPEDHDQEDAPPPLQRLRRSSDESYHHEEGDEEEDDETKDGATEDDQHPKAQHFFPSFAPLFSPPPLGHSRPSFYNQESAFSQRPSYPGGFRDLSYPHAVAESESSTNVLGSGNFGVLRGGTFFAGERDELLSDDLYSPYFHGGNNGHGRPSFYPRNPQPNYRQQGDDFFANFRDFADISTPTKSSYSQYYVVYARQNATNDEQLPKPKMVDEDVDYEDGGSKTLTNNNTPQQRPRNIMEQLTLLDTTVSHPPAQQPPRNIIEQLSLLDTAVSQPSLQRPRNIIEQLSLLDTAISQPSQHQTPKKFSKRKLKLHIYKKKLEEKQDRAAVKSTVSPKDIYDPLLALS